MQAIDCFIFGKITYTQSGVVEESQACTGLGYTFSIGFGQKWLEIIFCRSLQLAEHIEKLQERIVPWQIGDENHGRLCFGIVSTKSKAKL